MAAGPPGRGADRHAPGVGLTGSAVLRAQRDPRTTTLVNEEHGHESPSVLLLHGLGAAAAFWRPVAQCLAERGRGTLLPDLLGFGSSRRLGTHFHLDDQAAAVIRLLENRRPTVLVAHSYGAVVAVAVAAERPELVDRLVLISPAVFADPDEARRRIGARSWLARKTVSGSPVAGLACGAMCLLRAPLTFLAPRLASSFSPDVPAQVARDAVTYLWPAYRDALRSLLEDNPLGPWLADPPLPTTVVLAEDDRTVPADGLVALVGPRVEMVRLAGTHALPIEHPDRVANAITATGPEQSQPD